MTFIRPALTLVFTVAGLLLSQLVYGQFHGQRPEVLKSNSHWFFGSWAMDLNQNPPVISESPKFYNAYSFPYEDGLNFSTAFLGLKFSNVIPVSHPQTGNLRFVVLRNEILDKNLDVMPNSALDPYLFYPVSFQKNIAVAPLLDDPDRYYCFNLSEQWYQGLTCSIVNMKLNNGLGDVEPETKGTIVKKLIYQSSVPEIIDIIPGDNCDYWLLYAENDASGLSCKIVAVNITENGINPNAVVSSFAKEDVYQLVWDFQISPDRSTIAFISYREMLDGKTNPLSRIHFLKFDRESGVVSASHLPEIVVPLKEKGMDVHGSFTPDNHYYIVCNNEYKGGNVIFTKYDLSAYYSNYNATPFAYPLAYDVLSAKLKIRYVPPVIFLKPYGNTFYFNIPKSAKKPYMDGFMVDCSTMYKMGSLFPADGTGWTQTGFGPEHPLYGGNRIFMNSDVTFPYKPVDTIPNVYLDSVICFDPGIPFPQMTLNAKNGFNSYTWDDGTTGPDRVIDQPGKYWVYYKGNCNSRVDSFIFRFRERKKILSDTLACEQRFPIEVKAQETGQYLWEDNSNLQIRNIYHPGTYSVIFEAFGCRQFDTMIVTSEHCPCSISVPNAFSPNGDGLNDYFKPVIGLGCVPAQYSLKVFNRWGQQVYRSNNEFNAGWDGSTASGTADAGVYFFELRFKTKERPEEVYRKGELILIR
jgi:gliding motility-associated-like protein